MTTSSSSTAAALVTGSLLVAAGLLYQQWPFQKDIGTKDASASRDLVDIDDMDGPGTDNNDDDDGGGDYITEQEVVKIFDRLFVELQGTFAQLMQQIQQIQMSGQHIPQAQIQAILKAELTRNLQQRQQLVLDEYDMDAECLEEATWEFLASSTDDEDGTKHAAVRRAVDRFQKFWESTTGQAVTGWRKGQSSLSPTAAAAAADLIEPLSAERTVEVAQVYFAALTGAMRATIAEYQAAGKDLQEPAVQNALNMEFARRANPAGEAALEAAGTSQAAFEASVKAHGGNKQVAGALHMMQVRQQQELLHMSSSAAAAAAAR